MTYKGDLGTLPLADMTYKGDLETLPLADMTYKGCSLSSAIEWFNRSCMICSIATESLSYIISKTDVGWKS